MNNQTTTERFWAEFVEPEDSKYRAKTLNNEPLIITGTAKEICEFIEGEKKMQLRRIVEELEEDEMFGEKSEYHDGYNDARKTAIEIIKKYAKHNQTKTN